MMGVDMTDISSKTNAAKSRIVSGVAGLSIVWSSKALLLIKAKVPASSRRGVEGNIVRLWQLDAEYKPVRSR
jgi:hypothetical protein